MAPSNTQSPILKRWASESTPGLPPRGTSPTSEKDTLGGGEAEGGAASRFRVSQPSVGLKLRPHGQPEQPRARLNRTGHTCAAAPHPPSPAPPVRVLDVRPAPPPTLATPPDTASLRALHCRASVWGRLTATAAHAPKPFSKSDPHQGERCALRPARRAVNCWVEAAPLERRLARLFGVLLSPCRERLPDGKGQGSSGAPQ